jgi:phosphopentomutase
VNYRRAFCLVLDSLGVGALPDAPRFGDAGANTLAHIADAAGPLELPVLASLGLGKLVEARGLVSPEVPRAAYGRCAELSAGKDTSSGHWEMMGQPVARAFATFPQGFPAEILEPFCRAAGVPAVLGNVAASGTEILERLGPEHERTGLPIVYTSADSVFQIAAHLDRVPLERLYAWCEAARKILDPHRVGRVIARPFRGRVGAYQRTYDRRDYSMLPPGPTWLDRLQESGVPTIGVGKIEDIFAGQGLTRSIHTEGNRDGMAATVGLASELEHGFVFVNLVDFDMLYGHRRDAQGYARALAEFDADLEVLLGALRPDDLLLLTADHGNDPLHGGTDHTREYVPLLATDGRSSLRGDLGIRSSFADVGATIGAAFAVPARGLPGRSLWS